MSYLDSAVVVEIADASDEPQRLTRRDG